MQKKRSYSFDISTKSKGDTENAYYKTYYTVVFCSWVLCQCRHTVSVESVFQLERVLCVCALFVTFQCQAFNLLFSDMCSERGDDV